MFKNLLTKVKPKRITKVELLEKYLLNRKNKWVNGWKMVMYVKTMHHQELIRVLRKKYTIENKVEVKDGTRLTFYKLILQDD